MQMRTHYCGQVTKTSLGQEIQVTGWVHRRRDHGGIIFLDVRDRAGMVQMVFAPEKKALFTQAERLRDEYVVQVKGRVRERPEGTVNAHLATGEIEIDAEALVIFNRAEALPFPIDEYHEVS